MRLTVRRLAAIEEALCSRLAGPIDLEGEDFCIDDYDHALSWVWQEMARRKQLLKTRDRSVKTR